MSAEWGAWIEHDGSGCPVVGQFVHVVLGDDWETPILGSGDCGWGPQWKPINEAEAVGIAEDDPGWHWAFGWFPVIRYRVRKPRALQDLIEMVERMPERVDA
jgi:hypothetical protein